MKIKHLILIISLILTCGLASLNLASSDDTVYPLVAQTVWGSGTSTQLIVVHPSTAGLGGSAVYETFLTGSTAVYLRSIIIRVATDGTIGTTTYRITLANVSVQAYNSVPTETLAVSNNKSLTGGILPADAVPVQFDFLEYALLPNTYYAFYVEILDTALMDAGNYMRIMGSSTGTYAGYFQIFHDTHWNTGVTTSDLYCIINVADGLMPTPSPSPSPTVAPTILPVVDTSVPSFYMIILVLFAVVAVLAGIYVGFERDGGNKGVAFLFALVALVIFVVLIVGYLAG